MQYRRPRDTWSRDARLDRMHRVWIAALQTQIEVNPDLPTELGKQILAYQAAADEFRDSELVRSVWWDDYDTQLQECRHEVVAALRTLNQHAMSHAAHLGLTSCDVTESSVQLGIRESMLYVHWRVCQIAKLIADQVDTHRGRRMVARTHGQPAQLTTLGYRMATLLEPLNQWVERWVWYVYSGYYSRPLAGAVGTSADLARVLAGWRDEKAPTMASGATRSPSEPSEGIDTPPAQPTATEWLLTMGDRMAAQLKATARNPDMAATAANYERIRQETSGKSGFLTRRVSPWDTSYPGNERPGVSDLLVDFETRIRPALGLGVMSSSSRQVYHRSADLHWAAMLAELASIAQTWANDRRLESMLGLGAEVFGPAQVGSSAMPHKQNPRFSERVCALAAVTRSHLTAFAELAGSEWLEGDVSTSAARRKLIAEAFENIDALLQNWAWVITNWVANLDAMSGEVDRCLNQLSTGALIQAAIEAPALLGNVPMPREEAHRCILDAFQKMAGWTPANHRDGTQLAFVLSDILIWPLTEEQTRGVIEDVAVSAIGDIDSIMTQVNEEALDRHQGALDLAELEQWLGELR